jgi:hypothetical protein
VTDRRIVFLGPSLPRSEARRLVDADFRPPARQGDVFRALLEHPRAIALIDGVFESEPSVWHHELIAASAAGVRVYGAASMGALRAAELPGVVIPVGEIARRYLRGDWVDDAHVALLHAASERHGYRALTVPHVNVWATARAALRQRLFGRARANQLEAVSAAQFYQRRTWDTVLAALDWPREEVEALRRFVQRSAVDLKASDARRCLVRLAAAPKARGPRPARFSSFVRRTRPTGVQPPASEEKRRALEDAGTRTLLIAAFAKAGGLRAPPARIRWWLERLPRRGWADDERAAAAETLALEELVLGAPEYFVSDGPSRAEGLRLEAQRRRT